MVNKKIINISNSGININIFNNINNIKIFLKNEKYKYVIQEGIINLDLYNDMKYDIRAHVLFINNNGNLDIYLHKYPYLRLIFKKYNKESINDIDNLTNTHIQEKLKL